MCPEFLIQLSVSVVDLFSEYDVVILLCWSFVLPTLCMGLLVRVRLRVRERLGVIYNVLMGIIKKYITIKLFFALILHMTRGALYLLLLALCYCTIYILLTLILASVDSAATKKSVGVSEEAPGVAESGVIKAAIESDKETVATAQSI